MGGPRRRKKRRPLGAAERIARDVASLRWLDILDDKSLHPVEARMRRRRVGRLLVEVALELQRDADRETRWGMGPDLAPVERKIVAHLQGRLRAVAERLSPGVVALFDPDHDPGEENEP